ncbi:SHOCT domain-containing protein [Georgenia sp. SYP-B2076]|uniref:SHOCT domain-containing protein n=1 Tax=Georgenia sp. SYP-B2076 TaxID=2495881 RepID=UPI000F8F635A|nr:SHOCT domain-containing protein [Georgenia sp. SYP-B2076]
MENYPLLGLFLTMLWFFLFFAWISLLVSIFRDIFRSSDLSGWGKAGWILLVVILPLLGVLIYVIARGGQMQLREHEDAVEREKAVASYIRSVAPASTPSTADELVKLGRLRDTGVLTAAEFELQKSALLA